MFSLSSVGRVAAAAVACVAAASFLLSGPARAQSFVPPPAISSVDGNGVDLASGKFTLPSLNIAIGASGSGLSRIAGPNGSDNEVGKMLQTSVPLGFLGQDGTMLYIDVSYGGKTDRFRIAYSPQGQSADTTNRSPYYVDGDQLSCDNVGTTIFYPQGNCYLTLTDGTVATYTRAASGSVEWGTLTNVTKPDGEVLSYTYYMSGSSTKAIKSVSSSLGWMLKYEVDGNYKITKITGINTSVAYCDPQATSCAVSTSFPYGTQTTNGTTTTVAQNGVTVVSYAINANVVTLTLPGNVTKTVTYSGTDTTGRVASVSMGGSTWNYAYTLDGSGNITQAVVTAPNQTTKKWNFGTSGLASYIDEAGRVTTYSRYADTSSSLYGAIAAVVAPDGNLTTGGYTSYSYDSHGNIATVTVVPKGGATNGTPNAGAAMVTQYHYPACDYSQTGNYRYCNKPDYVIDANGVRTDYIYYPEHGGVKTETLPVVNGVAPQTRYFYTQLTPQVKNSSGVLVAQAPVWRLTSTSSCMTQSTCSGTTDERKTTLGYTSTNLLPNSSTVALGDGNLAQTTTTTYNDNGQVLTVDGPKAGTVDTIYTLYDTAGRESGTIGIDPDNSGSRPRPASKIVYDTYGRVSEVDAGTVTGTDANALGTMTIVTRDTTTFDATTGLPTVAKHFIGTLSTPQNVTQTSYDNLFRQTCVAQRLNPTDFTNLPASACTLGTSGSDGSHDRITQYNYDSVTGLLVSTVSGYGTQAARTEAYRSYDTVGATSTGTLTYAEDGKGNRTSYFYDSFNRLIKTCYPATASLHYSSTTDCEQRTYRSTGVTGTSQANSLVNSVTLRDGTSTITFGYDGLARVSSKSGAVSESVTYDNFGQVKTHINNTTGGASASETYDYNALGWLNSDTQPSGKVSYLYDANGKRTRMTWPDNFYVTYGYDDGDEVTGIFENGAVQIAGFGYDNYGRRNALNRPNGFNDSYGFDGALRLQTQALVASGVSNTITLGYNQADQITSRTNSNSTFAPPTPTVNTSTIYTINGVNAVTTAGSSTLTYTDGRGNMTSDGAVNYTYNANNLMTSTSNGASFIYDAENRLQSYTASGTTTTFLYDGSDLIAEYNGTTLTRRYVHGPGTDEPLVRYDDAGTGSRRYLMADERGSIVGVTDASGNILATNTYDAYGIPSSTNSATVAGRFRYTGQIYLPELGIYYYKARMYAPTLGRFMQTDPIGYGDGMNWYAYVHGDPVNAIDPNGTDWLPPRQLPGGCYETRYFEPVNTANLNSPLQQADTEVFVRGHIVRNTVCPDQKSQQDPNGPSIPNGSVPWGQPTGQCMATSFDDPAYYEFEAAKSRAGASAFDLHLLFLKELAKAAGWGKGTQATFDNTKGKLPSPPFPGGSLPGQKFADKTSPVLKKWTSWEYMVVTGTMAAIDVAASKAENDRAVDFEKRRKAVAKECNVQ